MNRKYFKPIAIAAIALIAFFTLWRNMNHTSNWKPDLFALKNPNDITKFVFTPNNDKKTSLQFQKIDGVWFVINNTDKYVADTSSINLLLNWAMPKLKIKRPTSDEEKKFATRALTIDGTKATFYKDNEPVHTIYIGNSTQANDATYMFYPETDRPCVVEIPGFQGYVTPYFNNDINSWRTPYLINEEPSNIEKLSIFYPFNPTESFSILQQNDELTLLNSQNKSVNAKRGLIAGYLLLCKDFAREAGQVAGINSDLLKRDTILKSTPYVLFTYTLKSKKQIVIQAYPLPNSAEPISMQANRETAKTISTELYWVKASNDPLIWMAQDVILKNRLKKLSDFLQ